MGRGGLDLWRSCRHEPQRSRGLEAVEASGGSRSVWGTSKRLEAVEGCGGGRKLWRRLKALEEVEGSGGSTARSSGGSGISLHGNDSHRKSTSVFGREFHRGVT